MVMVFKRLQFPLCGSELLLLKIGTMELGRYDIG